MPVGSLFTISAINVARAALRAADQAITARHTTVKVKSDHPTGSAQLYIEIRSSDGSTRKLDVDDQAIRACLAAQDHETCMQMTNALIDELAASIRAALHRNTSHGPLPDKPTLARAQSSGSVVRHEGE